jgi:hypothetical protein
MSTHTSQDRAHSTLQGELHALQEHTSSAREVAEIEKSSLRVNPARLVAAIGGLRGSLVRFRFVIVYLTRHPIRAKAGRQGIRVSEGRGCAGRCYDLLHAPLPLAIYSAFPL